jgi:hypothetical protein
MKNVAAFCSAVLFACSCAHAADDPSAAIGRIEGVYKHRFMSAMVVGDGQPDEPYQEENIVEIVPYDASHVYFLVKLGFYNGHSCGISGIAAHEAGAFVYREPAPAYQGAASCVLTLSVANGKLKVSDWLPPANDSSCRAYCGMRGSLGAVTFPYSARRKIRYLDRIKASRQYRAAVEQHRQAPAE